MKPAWQLHGEGALVLKSKGFAVFPHGLSCSGAQGVGVPMADWPLALGYLGHQWFMDYHLLAEAL